MKYHIECVRKILAGEIPCFYCEELMDQIDMDNGREDPEQLMFNVPE